MGAHGGAVAGSQVLKNYLVNFSRPFIYTTAPSLYQVNTVKTAYSLLQSPAYEKNRLALRKNILFFAETIGAQFPGTDIQQSHINKLTVGNLDKTIALAAALRERGYICRPVLSPTVEEGRERIRINLHAYNTLEEITGLVNTCKTLLS
jgi:8-amino-7-oxononanoate synthase